MNLESDSLKNLDSDLLKNSELNFSIQGRESINVMIEDITSCGNEFIKLAGALAVFSEIEGSKNEEFMVNTINEIISKIENSNGFKVFKRLYKVKYVENENGIEKAREASLLEIIEGMPPNVTPELPWVIDNGHALFKKDKEELLIEQSITQNINLKFNVEEDVYGTIRFLSPKHNLILQDMRNYSLRSREICEMFCQMLIAERFNRYSEEDDKSEISLEKLPELDRKDTTQSRKFSQPINNYIDELFSIAYEKSKSRVEEGFKLPALINANDPIWNELISSGIKLRNCILEFKQNNAGFIKLFKAKDDDILLREIREFLLNSNNNFDQLVLPTLQELSDQKPGGPGLVKKIGDNGGIKKIQTIYIPWITRKIKEEKSLLENLQTATVEKENSLRKIDLSKIDIY